MLLADFVFDRVATDVPTLSFKTSISNYSGHFASAGL